jgi:hypothetical protein
MVILAPKTRRFKPAYSNGKQVAASDMHLNCAEVREVRATRWKRQSSASLGTKDGASQEDKGGRNVKPRWTAFQVGHLREEGNVMMGVIVDGHLDHKPVQYQLKDSDASLPGAWYEAPCGAMFGTMSDRQLDTRGTTEVNPGVSLIKNTSKFLESTRAKYSSRLVSQIKCWCARLSMTFGSPSASTVLWMNLSEWIFPLLSSKDGCLCLLFNTLASECPIAAARHVAHPCASCASSTDSKGTSPWRYTLQCGCARSWRQEIALSLISTRHEWLPEAYAVPAWSLPVRGAHDAAVTSPVGVSHRLAGTREKSRRYLACWTHGSHHSASMSPCTALTC